MGKYDLNNIDIAWCPGCGNFGIHNEIKNALESLDLDQQNVVFVSGIGQAAKMPQYIKCHFFNGLHGRAMPVATAISASNPNLTVIAEGGDGDMYGEGGNHFIHNIRRNPNLTHIVHNNMIYGLTKGQASPTSGKGHQTPVQVSGVILEPFNPLAVALSLKATFVARAYSGDKEQTEKILAQAIQHKGYALVDLLHPCVSFNKINTYKWYKENTYYLDDSHDTSDRNSAFAKAMESDKLALGVYYREEGRDTFTDKLDAYQSSKEPLYRSFHDREKLQEMINAKVGVE